MIGNPRYPTYQVFLALTFAAIITAFLMPYFIRIMRRGGVGQQIRADGPSRHLIKQGTPTMGGAVMLVGILITSFLMNTWTPQLIVAVVAIYATSLLGLLDDIESVAHARSLGLTPRQKMIGLFVISVTFALVCVNYLGISPEIMFPGGASINLGILPINFTAFGAQITIPWLYVLFVFLLVAGLSNSVNLTDGLDGLASGCVFVCMTALAAVSFLVNDIQIAMLSGAIAGSCIGFLWYNCYPAEIFMGDTGSLALGSAIGVIAVLTKAEVIALIMSGLFIAEALSVIVQVASFKLTGKRVFLMAPLHHHFEQKGWSETHVVIRFWIVSALFVMLGFALYFQLT